MDVKDEDVIGDLSAMYIYLQLEKTIKDLSTIENLDTNLNFLKNELKDLPQNTISSLDIDKFINTMLTHPNLSYEIIEKWKIDNNDNAYSDNVSSSPDINYIKYVIESIIKCWNINIDYSLIKSSIQPPDYYFKDMFEYYYEANILSTNKDMPANIVNSLELFMETINQSIFNSIDKDDPMILISTLRRFSFLALSNKLCINEKTNENLIKKIFEKIIYLKKSSYQNEIIFTEKFKEICLTIIDIPWLGEISGFYLLAQYEQFNNIKFENDANASSLTTKELYERHISGNSSYKSKIKQHFNIDLDKYIKDDCNYIYHLFDYIHYSLFESTNNTEKNATELDRHRNFNLFTYFKNSSLEFSLNEYNIADSKPRIAMAFLKSVLLTRSKNYEQINIDNEIFILKALFRYGKLYSFIDDKPFGEFLHYDNDEKMATILSSIYNKLKKININITYNSNFNFNSIFSNLLYKLIAKMNQIECLNLIYYYSNFDTTEINHGILTNEPNPLNKHSPLFYPLTETQKKAFITLYNPSIEIDKYKQKYYLNKQDLLKLIKNNTDLLNDFLGNPNLTDREFKKIVNMTMKLVSIYQTSLPYYEKKAHKNIFELGIFLASLLIIYLLKDTKFRILVFKNSKLNTTYQHSKGARAKNFYALIRNIQDNKYPQVYFLLTFILTCRYNLNLGWNKTFPYFFQSFLLVEKSIMEICTKCDNIYSCKESIINYYHNVNKILNEGLEQYIN